MSILKDPEFRNKYIINSDSTNDDFQKIINDIGAKNVRCIICNSNTARHFRVGLLGNPIITINNKVPPLVFYINGVY